MEKNVRKVVYVPVKQVGIPNNNPFHCDPCVVNVEAKVPEFLNLQQLIVNKRGQPCFETMLVKIPRLDLRIYGRKNVGCWKPKNLTKCSEICFWVILLSHVVRPVCFDMHGPQMS